MRRIASFILLISLMLLVENCAKHQSLSSKMLAAFPEMQVKEKLQALDAYQSQLVAPNRSTGQANRTEFILPAGPSYSSAADLFISDNNGQTFIAGQPRMTVQMFSSPKMPLVSWSSRMPSSGLTVTFLWPTTMA